MNDLNSMRIFCLKPEAAEERKFQALAAFILDLKGAASKDFEAAVSLSVAHNSSGGIIWADCLV